MARAIRRKKTGLERSASANNGGSRATAIVCHGVSPVNSITTDTTHPRNEIVVSVFFPRLHRDLLDDILHRLRRTLLHYPLRGKTATVSIDFSSNIASTVSCFLPIKTHVLNVFIFGENAVQRRSVFAWNILSNCGKRFLGISEYTHAQEQRT